LLLCSSIDITYKENNEIITFKNLGTYADGTILFDVAFEKDSDFSHNIRLLHPNGTFNFIDNNNFLNIPCGDLHCYEIYPLNPNYLLIALKNDSRVMIMNWTGYIINSIPLDRTYSFLATSEKNDSKFLVADYEESRVQLLYDEYIIDGDGQIIRGMNGNQTMNNGEIVKIISIISINDTWGIAFMQMTDCYLLIIPTNRPIHISFGFGREIACVVDKVKYYCIISYYDSLIWFNINKSTPDVVSQFKRFTLKKGFITHISTISDVCFLIQYGTDSYFVLNNEIDYGDPNSVFGELVLNDNFTHIGTFPNNTIVRMMIFDFYKDLYNLSFTNLTPRIPKGMYGHL